MKKIGEYVPKNQNNDSEIIHREWYRQGLVVKNDEAFYNEEFQDIVCYIPELSDEKYTRKDLIAMCDNQFDIAMKLYEQLDWQSPETLLDEWERGGEITTCEHCNRMFFSYESLRCPFCKKENKER